MCARVPRGR